jgi:hypothetical protein
VGEPAGEEDEDEVLGFGGMVGGARGERGAALEFRGQRKGGVEAEASGSTTFQKATASHDEVLLGFTGLLPSPLPQSAADP